MWAINLLPYLYAFVAAFLMVGLVSANTRTVVLGDVRVAAVLSYLINTMWVIAVRQVATKGWVVGQAYAVGAAFGCIAGTLVSRRFNKIKDAN